MITRYSNRKLYDKDLSQYVTLDEVAKQVRDGKAVRVTRKGSGEDITALTLAHAVVSGIESGGLQCDEALLIAALRSMKPKSIQSELRDLQNEGAT